MQGACTILSSVACPAVHYASILSHNRHDFLKKNLNVKCVFRFPLQRLFDTFFIVGSNERDMIKKCILVFM